MQMAEKSIIIIGAGLAGLSAGCYAQMNGYRTQIFEMHTLPGGLCTSWKRKGYTFDGCIHWLMGSRSGAFHRFYKELGAVQDRPMVDHKEFLRVEGPGGKTWSVYTDIDRLEQHMLELSPADAGVIVELCSAARVLTRGDLPLEKPLEWMGLSDVLKMLKTIRRTLTTGKYAKISTQEYASRFSGPFLREVFPLFLDDPPGFPMMASLNALAAFHNRNGGWPIGGSLAFAQAIERRYLELGGTVHYKSRVKEILVDASSERPTRDVGRRRAGRGLSHAIGVRLADGTEHRADRVISAADGRTTIFDMLGGKYVDDKIRSTYDEWPVYPPYIQISLGVARDLSGEPHQLVLSFEEPLDVGGGSCRWLRLNHYCYDPTMAPPSKSALTVTLQNSDYAYWKALYEDRERYKAEKQRLADTVIARLEVRFPGITGQIEVVDVATPLTFQRYTGNWQGSYMGWADTTETVLKLMSRTLPGLSSFYMAGQWVHPGGGVPGAVTSGRHVMQVICKQDKRPFVTTVP
jgi:phytoene dehydrogenase-like protein